MFGPAGAAGSYSLGSAQVIPGEIIVAAWSIKAGELPSANLNACGH